MALFVLVPGAGGQAAYWALLVPELERRGHQATAVDIAEDDPALGLPDYARIVDQAIGDRREVVLVAQSMGGFTAPMVGKPVAMIVLLNAMIPDPGETPGQWFENTGAGEARCAADAAAGRSGEFDASTHFLHDLSSRAMDRPVRPPILPSGSRVCSGAGPASRSRCWPPPTTASFPLSSSAASPKTGSASTPTRFPAGTWSRSATQPASPTDSPAMRPNSGMAVGAEADPEAVFAVPLTVRHAAVGQDHPARWLIVDVAGQQYPVQP